MYSNSANEAMLSFSLVFALSVRLVRVVCEWYVLLIFFGSFRFVWLPLCLFVVMFCFDRWDPLQTLLVLCIVGAGRDTMCCFCTLFALVVVFECIMC